MIPYNFKKRRKENLITMYEQKLKSAKEKGNRNDMNYYELQIKKEMEKEINPYGKIYIR